MTSTSQFSNKNIAILGFGVEGQSAANFLNSAGATGTIFDAKGKEKFQSEMLATLEQNGWTFKSGDFKDLETFDLVVRSPGISMHHPELLKISKDSITSVTKIFFDHCPAKIIGVTGTKGKGTTSTLIYQMVQAAGRDVYLGGNIGLPPLSFLEKLTPDSIVVLELSSFQLSDLHKSPHIAVMLMITAEHLDYHQNIGEYVDAKRNIVKFQESSDYAIFNKDYPATNESDIHSAGQIFYVSRENEVDQGCFVKEGTVVVTQNGKETPIIPTKDILLPGEHNWENVCAAVMTATIMGVDKKMITQVLKAFKGLEHRLELVRTVRGVRYFDDSFSTTPETAQAAILAFEDPEIIILGGSSKNSDFTKLGEVIGGRENIKAIIGIGAEWPRIKEQIKDWHFQIIEGLTTMEEIVQKAAEIAMPGDVVILSPACASFDMFRDYKDRGEKFNLAVRSL